MEKVISKDETFIRLIKDAKNNSEKLINSYKSMRDELMITTTIKTNNNKNKIMECDFFNLFKDGSLTEKNKDKLKRIFILVFGEDFYKDEDLLSLIKPTYKTYKGIYYGKPESFDDLINLLAMYEKYISDPHNLQTERIKLEKIISSINYDILSMLLKYEKIIRKNEDLCKSLNEIVNKINSNKKIFIEENDNFYNIANEVMYIVTKESEQEMGLGDILKLYIERHNNDLETKKHIKESDKYFKKLTKENKELKWTDFPKPEDENYRNIESNLSKKFVDADRFDLLAMMNLNEAHCIRNKINK